MIVLLVMTDGRDDALAETLHNFTHMVTGFDVAVIHDDSGDAEHRRHLADRYPWARIIGGDRAGFGGAINRAWETIRIGFSDADHVFHLEDDFIFREEIDLADLRGLLDDHPHIAQVAFRRQPWNDREAAAGGIVEADPDEFTDHQDSRGRYWLEHRKFFSTNPCLYRAELLSRGWPTGPHSEGHFGIALFAENPATTSAYWGPRDSAPKVHHIGTHRVGTGY